MYECALTVNSGKEVTVRAKLVAGTRGSAILEIVTAAGGSVPRARIVRSQIGQERNGETEPLDAAVIAVTGEPGTGRTTLATKIAGSERELFDACAAPDDPGKWIIGVRTALRTSTPVVLDNVDALNHRLAKLMANALQGIAGQAVLVSAPLAS